MSKVLVTKSKLDALVDAYNTLTSSSGKQTLDALATSISEIQTGGGDPSEDLQTVLENPAEGFSIINKANRIRSNSFYSSNIKTGSFPNAVSVGSSAFYSCYYLTSISIPKTTEINTTAFYSCTTLSEISFELCRTVYGNAFSYCSALRTVNLPVCTRFTGDAFNGCGSLRNINIPLVREVGQKCFNNCNHLENLEFNANVSAINAQAFYGCTALTKLVFSGNTSVPALGNANAFTNTPIASGTGYIYVPDALLEELKAATNWATYAARIKPLSELPA